MSRCSYNGIYVSVDKVTQKVAVRLPENQSVFILQSSYLSSILGNDLEQNQTGVIMKEKVHIIPSILTTL